ncbi:MAG: hypothetical protein LUD19_02515, partial [Clostridia bacterium]|nr:hypothetical protein [Clostridia bacterium]
AKYYIMRKIHFFTVSCKQVAANSGALVWQSYTFAPVYYFYIQGAVSRKADTPMKIRLSAATPCGARN